MKVSASTTSYQNFKHQKNINQLLVRIRFHYQLVLSSVRKNNAMLIKTPMPIDLKASLIPKLRLQFGSVDFNIITLDYAFENKVDIINNGNRIVASVECIFCGSESQTQKKICIQFNTTENTTSAYWNFSNLRKHLKKHGTIKKRSLNNVNTKYLNVNISNSQKKADEKSFVEIGDQSCDKEDESIILLDLQKSISNDFQNKSNVEEKKICTIRIKSEAIESSDNEKLVDSIYEQVSQQNLKLTQAILTNQERKYNMGFRLNDKDEKIKVIKISKDESCLFASLAHQLFHHKANSTEHREATNDLRKATVEYILHNIERFFFEIRGRVFEDREDEEKQIKSKKPEEKNEVQMKSNKDDENKENQNKKNIVTDEECKAFVTEKLIKFDCWGGTESLKAISKMHHVNILIFCELGDFYFPFEFDPSLSTVFLAYRLASKQVTSKQTLKSGEKNSKLIRNHYDSVSEVEKEIMYECIKTLAEWEAKRRPN